MKRALRSLEQVMSKNTALTLDRLELQTLQDETLRLERDANDDDYDENDEDDSHKKGIVRVAERYRASQVSRAALLEECNAVMEQFEDAEEADRRARQAAKNQVDEDGFVSVSYANQSVGDKHQLEESGGRSSKSNKRSRKKKNHGASELSDFYRFQMKASRKQTLQDLRKKFEQDLAKVNKMKEERQYRPFQG